MPAGETAYLVGDLDCRDSGSAGVVLSHRSRLVLGGYAIFGDPADDSGAWQGVRCKTGTLCSVHGPGAIVGFSASGVAGTRVKLRNLVIAENGRVGVAAYENVLLRDVVIDGNGAAGVHAGGRVRLRDSTVSEHPRRAIIEMGSPTYRPVRAAGADVSD